ncbi:hypothetical protein OHB44_01875 [Micromonospora sp. NBC_00821]|uniref:hypothetical protein n=1 Tax=Micromonospora sp. NBC_00821 TaxID=2975977 RepID=UPI002ED2F7BD|nr:hypothetical protein OHB44_01875 [Micromonospora sp. NBC_00821]
MADSLGLVERQAPAPAPHPARRPARSLGSAVVATLPWSVLLAALPAAWSYTDVPAVDVLRYVAYWSLAVVLPGTLVHRAVRGGRGNLPEDLGFGAATGLLLELAAWVAAAATGQQHLLRWWPVPLVLAFLAVPRLRRHWRVGTRRPLPLAWHWSVVAVLLLVLLWAVAQWRLVPLPPVNHGYYQDLLYHLSLVQELTRDLPFQLPQMAGEPLRYHYLSDAHMAAGSMITGIPPATVLLRLWLAPVAVVSVLVTAGLARDLTGRWWAGPVAGAAAGLGMPVAVNSAIADGAFAFSFSSPSQTYVLPLLVLLAGICVDAVRGRPLGVAWALLPVLGLACAGAKSSALPPLIAGVAVAVAATWWQQRRRVPWPALATLLCLVVPMGVGYLLFAGGGAGTLAPQAFAFLHAMPQYRETIGAGDGVRGGGLLPFGLSRAGASGWLLTFVLLGWWLLVQLPRLIGMLVLAGPRRADPAPWLLSGAVLAGAGGIWTLHHPSLSQVYFWLDVLPFGAVLTVWLLTLARPPWPVAVSAAVLGVASYLLVPMMPRPAATMTGWMGVLGRSYLRLAVLLLLAALVAVGVRALLGRRDGGGRRRTVAVALAGVTAALLGASVARGVDGAVRYVQVAPGLPASVAQPSTVTAAEMRAALWLDEHAADDDVVATNVHCRPVQTTAHCDARAYWVTGLGGHRTVVESWGYTDAALAANGRRGLGYVRQDPPDPARFALNERVFQAPTAADLDQLRVDYRVRWLFADTRAGEVSPALAGLAEVRLVSGSVTVYELR